MCKVHSQDNFSQLKLKRNGEVAATFLVISGQEVKTIIARIDSDPRDDNWICEATNENGDVLSEKVKLHLESL